MANRSFIYTPDGDEQNSLEDCGLFELTGRNFKTRLHTVTFGTDANSLNANLIFKLRYNER